MTIFTARNYDDHEAVVFHSDPASGLRAIIAVHNTSRGPALGGCRMWPYANEQDAIEDVLRLSRGMTYKAAVADLPLGGGKAVIIGDPVKEKTSAKLQAMGRFVESLGGTYHTAEDVGTTVEDMDIMRAETEYVHGTSGGSGNPSPVTAFGVFQGIRAAARFRFGRNDVGGLKVAVQGLGHVGYRVCQYLNEADASLVVADLDDERVSRARNEFGAEAVPTDAIHRADVDIYSPCALGAVLNDRTIPEIRAKAVAGAANNQLAEQRHGQSLAEREILYAPDYVINAGGLIHIAFEHSEQDLVMARVGRIYDTLSEIFERSAGENLPPHVVADRMAEERFRRGTARAA